MPLGRDIIELFEAIGDRIEVSGQAPTWRVTGASFDAVMDFASDAYGDVTVVGREDRSRWWPRVTLTVTTDPALAAGAPPVESFRRPEPTPTPEPPREPAPQAQRQSQPGPPPAADRTAGLGEDGAPPRADPAPEPAPLSARHPTAGAVPQPRRDSDDAPHDGGQEVTDTGLGDDSPLMAIFAHQEELRQARQQARQQRGRFPRQRRGVD